MRKIVLTFGLISGAILGGMMAVTVPLHYNGTIGMTGGLILGYSTMVLAFLMVVFGIRTYRENIGGGSITFGRAFQVGILITLIGSLCYVVAWEIIYFNFLPDFADKYAAASIAEMTKKGASATELAAAQKEMDNFKVMYKNPLYNVAMTFVEVFPPGLIITLLAAAFLRRKHGRAPQLDKVTA